MEFVIPHTNVKVLDYENYVYLYSILVEEQERGKGHGTKALKEVIAYANAKKKPLLLFATHELGSDVDRLKEWYQTFGFYEEWNVIHTDYNYNMRLDVNKSL